jgi:hypothetical protein
MHATLENRIKTTTKCRSGVLKRKNIIEEGGALGVGVKKSKKAQKQGLRR